MLTLRPREKVEEVKDKPNGETQPEEKPSEKKPAKKSKKNYQKITKNS